MRRASVNGLSKTGMGRPLAFIFILASLFFGTLYCGGEQSGEGEKPKTEADEQVQSSPSETKQEENRARLGLVAVSHKTTGKGAGPGDQPPIEITVEMDKTKATAGEIVTYTVKINRAAGVEYKIPEVTKIGRLEVLDYQDSESPSPEEGRLIFIRTYRLQGFVVGTYRVPGIPIKYTDLDGKRHRIRSQRFGFAITPVIPPGEEPEDILDIKGPVFIKWAERLFVVLLAAAVVLAVATLITAVVFRRRRVARLMLGPKRAHELALEELEKLRAQNLLAKGLIKRHYRLLHRIFRRYLERRFNLRTIEKTSEEIMENLEKMKYFGRHTFEVAGQFMSAADVVKFATYRPDQKAIDETTKNVYYFIEMTRVRESQVSPSAAGNS